MSRRALKAALTISDAGSSPDASANTRQKLLEAAQQEFAERGFYDATIRDICNRAGLNIALVNYHFGDKLRLYTEVLRSCSHMTSRPGPLQHVDDPDADPVALLRELVALFLRNMRKGDSAFDKFMRQERLRPTPAMEFMIETSMRPAYQATCALVGRILGLPAEHDKTRLATHSVIAQIKHFGEPERLLTQLDPTILLNRSIESLAETIVDFSLAWFRTPPSHQGATRKSYATSRGPRGSSSKKPR